MYTLFLEFIKNVLTFYLNALRLRETWSLNTGDLHQLAFITLGTLNRLKWKKGYACRLLLGMVGHVRCGKYSIRQSTERTSRLAYLSIDASFSKSVNPLRLVLRLNASEVTQKSKPLLLLELVFHMANCAPDDNVPGHCATLTPICNALYCIYTRI